MHNTVQPKTFAGANFCDSACTCTCTYMYVHVKYYIIHIHIVYMYCCTNIHVHGGVPTSGGVDVDNLDKGCEPSVLCQHFSD